MCFRVNVRLTEEMRDESPRAVLLGWRVVRLQSVLASDMIDGARDFSMCSVYDQNDRSYAFDTLRDQCTRAGLTLIIDGTNENGGNAIIGGKPIEPLQRANLTAAVYDGFGEMLSAQGYYVYLNRAEALRFLRDNRGGGYFTNLALLRVEIDMRDLLVLEHNRNYPARPGMATCTRFHVVALERFAPDYMLGHNDDAPAYAEAAKQNPDAHRFDIV